MKRIIKIGFVFLLLSLSSCINIPTKTPGPTKTLKPIKTWSITPIPTMESYLDLFPADWEPDPLTAEKVDAVKNCDIERISSERYSKLGNDDDPYHLYEPETSCDWAVLAFVYAQQVKEDENLPENAKNAFGKAILDNHGFALSDPLFYNYFYESFTFVNKPEILNQKIIHVTIIYRWGGLGDSIEYTVDITHADEDPTITISNFKPESINSSLATNIDSSFVQALGNSLSNFLPIDSQFSLIPCYDNYPDWEIKLTFEDGNQIELKTNGSNMIYIGGPWQTRINSQNYIQFSTEFVIAVDDLIQEIGLPYGQPAGMTCRAEPVFEHAYP